MAPALRRRGAAGAAAPRSANGSLSERLAGPKPPRRVPRPRLCYDAAMLARRRDRTRGLALPSALAILLGAGRPAGAGNVSVRKVEAIEGPDTLVKIPLSAPLAARARGPWSR